MPAVEILPPIGAEPLAPMRDPVLVSDRGDAWMPHPFYRGMRTLLPLCEGIALAWAPCAPASGILLSLWGGNPDNPSDEAIACTISRNGLRALIRDLQSIDQQWGDVG